MSARNSKIIGFVLLYCIASIVFLIWILPKPTVSVDIVKLIQMGKAKYHTEADISKFGRQLNYHLKQYSHEHGVVIVSKQVVISGAEDITDKIAKLVFVEVK